jgi:squalene synthase HpnC
MALPNFSSELECYGPAAPTPLTPLTLEEARSYCRRLARAHYENFTVVSWLFPSSLRPHMYAVYAYCRWADDLADEVGSPQKSLQLLAWWRDELQRCHFAATATPRWSSSEAKPTNRHPVFVALEETIRQFELPITPFTDLLSAFEQDQQQTRYDSWDELLDYCRRSANPVGHLVLALAGCDSPENRVLSDEICTGLQLTNFWQDIARDYERGRIYLPNEAWQTVGYTEADFSHRTANSAFRVMLAEAVAGAEQHFRRGVRLLDEVPPWLRTDLALILRGGLAILTRIRTIDYDVWTQRPTLGKLGKLGLFLTTSLFGPRTALAHYRRPDFRSQTS